MTPEEIILALPDQVLEHLIDLYTDQLGLKIKVGARWTKYGNLKLTQRDIDWIVINWLKHRLQMRVSSDRGAQIQRIRELILEGPSTELELIEGEDDDL